LDWKVFIDKSSITDKICGGLRVMTEGKRRIDKEMNIGEILDKYPEAREVFQKHFGKGCFNCPGSRLETIDFGALMHNKDANEIVKELNAKIKV
jgi:hybrid cluster-associated redox disulfide protein